MRPVVRFLSEALIQQIVAEAREVLCRIGVTIHNPGIVAMLADRGAIVDRATGQARFTNELIDRSLKTVPAAFKLYDVTGREAVDLSGDVVNYTPGSAALHLLDYRSGTMRRPVTADYARYVRVVDQLPHIASQSTAMIPADVPERVSDSYRLYLSLLIGRKPVVTGAFTIESFDIMKDLQVAIRGSEAELARRPLTVFSCCPTSPLKWSDVTSQNLVDCARHAIPVEFISMPLSGFMAPVTLVGTLVEHTAETLSGIVISQTVNPGTPVLYGGSPAAFDIRYETTPMGAVETEMIDCAYNEIGKYLKVPTQAYIALSDAKLLDAQAGLETAMGATLAALSGINNISGPGMLDFESCFSIEKLVVDNEICGMTLRMIRGIEPKDDFPSLPLFEELLRDHHLLIAKHTRRHLKSEHYFPGPTIDRANRSRWQEEGSLTLGQRAHQEAEKLCKNPIPSPLADDVKKTLTDLMACEARRFGMEKLPDLGL
jgi:trimethylamine--corrinoid protein Co-methyltransferase